MQLQFFDDSAFGIMATKKLVERCGSENLDHLAYMIITPDAIQRQQETEILEYLYADGFDILGIRLRYLDDRDVEYLYKYGIREKIFNEVATHWHVTRLGLTSGISAAVLLRHPTSGAVTRLRALKGESDPMRSSAGTIRGDLKSLSKTLALIHSPDDISNFLREVGLAFTLHELEAACDPVAKHHSLGHNCVEVALARSRPLDGLTRIAGVFQARLLRYLVDASPLVAKNPMFEKIIAANTNYIENSRSSNLSIAEELIQYRTYADIIRDTLLTEGWLVLKEHIIESLGSATLQRLTVGTILTWFEKLAFGKELQYADLNQLTPLLRACGIYHDEWEMIRLKNFCFFISMKI